MIDTKKNYWFTVEPYVFVTFTTDSVLLYNTLDGVIIESSNCEVIGLIREVFEEKNCGVCLLQGEQLRHPVIAGFINELRDKFMGDITDVLLTQGKPVQLMPSLNLQNDIKRLKSDNRRSVGESIMHYLYEVSILFKSTENKNETVIMSFQSVFRFIKQIPYVNKVQLVDIMDYPGWEEVIDLLKDTVNHKEIILSYNKIDVGKIMEIPYDNFTLKVFIDFPVNEQQWDNVLSLLSVRGEERKVKIVFRITSENDFENANNLIDSHNIKDYIFKIVYTGKNLSFFEDNIYLTKDDILSDVQSLREIFAHQALNTNDFGKITVKANGDVYANTHFPPLGNITTHSIQEMLFKEMNEGLSWLRIRNQAPCNSCVYQWLCSSPSDYELEIGKPNLCHIRK